MTNETLPSILSHSMVMTDPYIIQDTKSPKRETHLKHSLSQKENLKLGQTVNFDGRSLDEKNHVPATVKFVDTEVFPIYFGGKPPAQKLRHSSPPPLGFPFIKSESHPFPSHLAVSEKRRERAEKRHYAKTLEEQAEQAKLLKFSQKEQEQKLIQMHIESDYWKPQIRYIRPKPRDKSSNFDPISGRDMPFYDNSIVTRKTSPFDFDKFAKVSNSLFLGNDHIDQAKNLYFPRCYTDVVHCQRRNPKQCIQIHDLRSEAPYQAYENSSIRTGRPGNGAPLLDNNGGFDTRLINYKSSNIERPQVKDFHRYA